MRKSTLSTENKETPVDWLILVLEMKILRRTCATSSGEHSARRNHSQVSAFLAEPIGRNVFNSGRHL